MKRITTTKTLIASLVLAVTSMSANATLIGDDLRGAHEFPSVGTEFDTGSYTPGDFIAEAGNGDVQTAIAPWYDVDVEATSILVNFVGSATWSVAAFNGLAISGIDSILSNFVVDTNMAGWDDSRLSFVDSALRMNWNGLSFTNSTFFNVSFDSSRSVPAPGTLALLGLAMIGLVRARRLI